MLTIYKQKPAPASHRGARLYLHAVRPGNFLSSAEDANRVRGVFGYVFLLSAGLRQDMLDVGGGGRPVFSSWQFVGFGGR